MRCVCCDYSDDGTPSIYRASLMDKAGSKRRFVFFDQRTGDEICNHCYVPPEPPLQEDETAHE